MRKVEHTLERVIFGARWLMAPFYLGLIVCLGVLLVKFVQELVHIVPGVLQMRETEVILAVLTMVDLSLAGNLLLMVIFAGYENFVSRIDVADEKDRPEWMGKVDYSGLKLKLVASIVAISAIHLLKSFMDVAEKSDRDLGWLIGIHMAFVISGVLLAWMDKLTGHDHH